MRISDGGFAPILACIASVTALAVAYEAASTLRSLKRLVHSGEEAISRAANGQRDEPSFTRQDGREGVLRRESKSREKLSRLRNGKGSQSTLDGLKVRCARLHNEPRQILLAFRAAVDPLLRLACRGGQQGVRVRTEGGPRHRMRGSARDPRQATIRS